MILDDPAQSFRSPDAAELVSAMASLQFPTDHARIGAAMDEMRDLAYRISIS